MKYIINSKNKDCLAQANIILVQWNDRIDILQLAHDYKKEIILKVPSYMKEQKEEIRSLITDAEDKLTLCVNTVADGVWCQENGIPFYFDSYLKTYPELLGALEMEAKYVMLDAPLFHEYDNIYKIVKQKNAEIIFLPTEARLDVFDNTDGETGPYIRPEDIDTYDGYCYFGDCDISRETTLLRLYKDDKKYTGSIKYIINNLNTEALNRLIVNDFGERRKNCNMTCMKNHSCHLCYTVLNLASKKEELKSFFETKK